MRTDRSRYQQLTAMVRWRRMQRDRAELMYRRAVQVVSSSHVQWQQAQAHLADLHAASRQLVRSLQPLQPGLQVQRLLALMTEGERVQAYRQAHLVCRARCQDARVLWCNAEANLKLIEQAHEALAQVLQQQQQAQCQIDVFDGQRSVMSCKQ